MYFKDYSPIPFSIPTLAVPQQVLFLIQSLKDYFKIDLYFFILNFNRCWLTLAKPASLLRMPLSCRLLIAPLPETFIPTSLFFHI